MISMKMPVRDLCMWTTSNTAFFSFQNGEVLLLRFVDNSNDRRGDFVHADFVQAHGLSSYLNTLDKSITFGGNVKIGVWWKRENRLSAYFRLKMWQICHQLDN